MLYEENSIRTNSIGNTGSTLKNLWGLQIQASTASMEKDLDAENDIEIFLTDNKENMLSHNLPFHLEMLLEQKGLSKAEVARRSQLDKYTYQIFSGEKTPSRDKLIAIAFGLGLSKKETQTLLKISENRELYVKDERDALIMFALNRNMTIFEVNELLYSHNFTVLGSPQE